MRFLFSNHELYINIDMLSKLVDQMLEKRNNETEIHELQELKEYIPLIKGMVCIVKSLTENVVK